MPHTNFLTDPLSMGPQKALEMIGSNLQKQYERWQPRARYKQSLDPTVEEVKKLCTSLRRNAKVIIVTSTNLVYEKYTCFHLLFSVKICSQLDVASS